MECECEVEGKERKVYLSKGLQSAGNRHPTQLATPTITIQPKMNPSKWCLLLASATATCHLLLATTDWELGSQLESRFGCRFFLLYFFVFCFLLKLKFCFFPVSGHFMHFTRCRPTKFVFFSLISFGCRLFCNSIEIECHEY